MIKRFGLAGLGLVVAALLVQPLNAYKFKGDKWPSPTTLMYIALGSPWDSAFGNAMGLWNQSTVFQFTSISQAADPCSNPNTAPKRNGVTFSNTECGNDFGSSTLAITLSWSSNNVSSQAGIIFNSKFNWSVYNGPWSNSTTDFQRVAVHELGHVIGLDHEDSVPAIMATAVTTGGTIVAPTADDIAGVNALYGAGSTDTLGPQLTITSHSNGQSVSTSSLTISGTATDSGLGDNGISSVTVNGIRAAADTASGSGTANWSRTLTLNPGANTITVVAKDNSAALNPTTVTITVTLTTAITSATANTYHVFPTFVDGRLSDGTYYRSTLMISNPSSSVASSCTLQLRGLTVPGFPLSYSIAASGWAISSSSGNQGFQSGYATLQCSANVEAQLLYSFYQPNGVKISEATVFSSPPAAASRILSDEREGAQLGLAIANDSDQTTTYNISVFSNSGTVVTGTVTLGPRSSIARFLNQFVSGIPANNTGQVLVSSSTGTASIIGLRFTGGVFTTIPGSAFSSVGATAGAYHVFPQFADGKFADSSYYRTTRLYVNPNPATVNCTTRLRGLTTGGAVGFMTTLPSGSFLIGPTSGTQAFQSGYATVDCSAPVDAQVLYSYYGANGVKLSEATVFSSPSAPMVQILADSREGARVGLAIANDSDQSTSYTIAVGDVNGNLVGSTTRTLGPRSNIAYFVDELVPLPPNHYGQVIVSSSAGTASIIGLRYTGAAFTTIPETIR